MSLQAIKYSGDRLTIIDQLQLPYVERYISIRTAQEGWHAIREMRVRGAPAIAIVAALALATELSSIIADNKLPSAAEEVRSFITEKLHYLVTSRPTAVNLSDASRKLQSLVERHASKPESSGREVASVYIRAAEDMLAKDLEDNTNLGRNGADWIVKNAVKPRNAKATVLTHCNTG